MEWICDQSMRSPTEIEAEPLILHVAGHDAPTIPHVPSPEAAAPLMRKLNVIVSLAPGHFVHRQVTLPTVPALGARYCASSSSVEGKKLNDQYVRVVPDAKILAGALVIQRGAPDPCAHVPSDCPIKVAPGVAFTIGALAGLHASVHKPVA